MKKILVLAIILTSNSIFSQTVNFNKGINITNWFQSGSAGEIQFSKYDKDDFIDIKSLGVDVIRLPINLEFMSDGAPDYTLDPLFFFFLDQVVDWSEELNISLILDNHTFDVTSSTPADYDKVLIPLWKQMAEHYKNRSNLILYEVLNEPHGISDSDWNAIQLKVVDAIRTIDTVHTIIVGPAGWNSYNNLSAMPVYPDTNLIYTFHFYDPFLFTHQGASWVDPSLVPLAGVPFPYDAARMPDTPPSLVGTWVEGSLWNYKNEGTIQHVRDLIDIAANFAQERHVKVYCGELGVLMFNAPDNDRVLWYNIVRQYLEYKNIPLTMWDYKGGFGLFEKNSNQLFDYDLNIFMLQAMGFNVPPQFEFNFVPDSTGFMIYDDYVGKNINSGYSGGGVIDFYNPDKHDGSFSLYWQGATQYSTLDFNFSPDKDLSYLLSENYQLRFWVKATDASDDFDVRFVDTKTGPDDHPWRMNYRINNTIVPFDGQWHLVEIPLSSFTEQGSYDNGWFPPEGKFDWSAIDKFQLVSETGTLTGEVYLDNIEIYNPNVVGVKETSLAIREFQLFQNYPNPFNPTTEISFVLPYEGYVQIDIFNALGQKVDNLFKGELNSGMHVMEWNATGLSSGIYLLNIKYNNAAGSQFRV
ncbi:MAG: T9SS C-terminal target domain-containing protein, partial [Ignavibacteria bacterium]